MKKLLLTCLMAIPYFGFAQITLNQKDDFENFTTANWTKYDGSDLPNQNISTGGPDGENDNFLRVQSSGVGDDSFLATLNSAQWTGDYINAGVRYISMDVRNSSENLITLRLSFNCINDWIGYWSTTTVEAIIPGENWKTIIFPIDDNNIVRFDGGGSYLENFTDVVELRILHDDAPSWYGDAIEATLDIDNIQARDSNMNVVDLENLKNKINIYPNPSTDFIKVEGLSAETEFQIFSTSGVLVKSGKTKNAENIHVKNLAKGIYLLKLEAGKTLKFVKE